MSERDPYMRRNPTRGGDCLIVQGAVGTAYIEKHLTNFINDEHNLKYSLQLIKHTQDLAHNVFTHGLITNPTLTLWEPVVVCTNQKLVNDAMSAGLLRLKGYQLVSTYNYDEIELKPQFGISTQGTIFMLASNMAPHIEGWLTLGNSVISELHIEGQKNPHFDSFLKLIETNLSAEFIQLKKKYEQEHNHEPTSPLLPHVLLTQTLVDIMLKHNKEIQPFSKKL
jgi:hypothetical protein